MFSTVLSASLQGMQAEFIHVEADVGNGLPFFPYGRSSCIGSKRVGRACSHGSKKSSGIQIPPRKVVINLSPALVVINAGTNDVAENTGAYNEDYTFGNIASMAELAKANKIKVILTSVLPAAEFPWRREIKDAPQKIQSLNARIEAYAKANKIPFVNYYQPMVVGENKALNPQYTKDGVHPTGEGYDIMEALIKQAIEKMRFNYR